MSTEFLPGTLVRARGRDWVVQSGSSDDWLRLRPMGGAEDEVTELCPELEFMPVETATFAWPDPKKVGPWWSADLLYNALRFQLRSGAGPFRSFGSIAVEPRSYQLVPLLMAMRQQVVRLLIADDVGIGKTIEAGLIVRELLDRGEITRVAVLCPPHLVDQWVEELEKRFNIHAEALTAGTAQRLDRKVPHGKTLVDISPCLVVSLDYIKSERHRDYFKSMNFEMVVVDEAHTCTKLSSGATQLRFELLKSLAADEGRNMIFLTATPHSGDETGFYNLLSLLKPEFGEYLTASESKKKALRYELSRHFVQRRRKDIEEWRVSADDRVVGFPRRLTSEDSYELSDEYAKFLEDVQQYCRGMLLGKEDNQILWYAVIALLRCASSSPAAAARTLYNRAAGRNSDEEADEADSLQDEFADAELEEVSDLEPVLPAGASDVENRLYQAALKLKDNPKKDEKLKRMRLHVEALLRDGFNPVIFCRYIETAKYVAEDLKKTFANDKEVGIECVTGELVPDERKACVERLGDYEKRILVATDCLSEGINLQEHLTAVIHYDLAWNPTRHEQREGRIDRFGQRAREVKCLMLYGSNNPVDGFILKVILRKSEAIRKSLGVSVPMPQNGRLISQALIEAIVFRKGKEPQRKEYTKQDEIPFVEAGNALEAQWKDALDQMKRTSTIFAQRAIHPNDIYPLWEEQQQVLGGHCDVERFCREAAAGLGFRLEPRKDGTYLLPLNSINDRSIKERLKDEGYENDAVLDFDEIHRSSPFVSALSEAVVDEAVAGNHSSVVRCGVTASDKADKVTQVYLLRLRYQMRIAYRNQTQKIFMAEEILPVSAAGRRSSTAVWDASGKASELISEKPQGNFTAAIAEGAIEKAEALLQDSADKLKEIAEARAKRLLEDHSKVKEYTAHGSVVSVEPCLPVDVMGIFVLLPADE